MHRDFVLCDIGWLEGGFYILLQSNEMFIREDLT